MIRPLSDTAALTVTVHPPGRLARRLSALAAFTCSDGPQPLSRHPLWLQVLSDGLGHEGYAIEATVGGRTCGYLPVSLVSSLLFGRFLVSLPYLNSNGVCARSPEVEALLLNQATELADELDVKYLELRHERPVDHPALTDQLSHKVHVRLRLPATAEALWKGFDP